jgi:hypothetical protein
MPPLNFCAGQLALVGNGRDGSVELGDIDGERLVVG